MGLVHTKSFSPRGGSACRGAGVRQGHVGGLSSSQACGLSLYLVCIAVQFEGENAGLLLKGFYLVMWGVSGQAAAAFGQVLGLWYLGAVVTSEHVLILGLCLYRHGHGGDFAAGKWGSVNFFDMDQFNLDQWPRKGIGEGFIEPEKTFSFHYGMNACYQMLLLLPGKRDRSARCRSMGGDPTLVNIVD